MLDVLDTARRQVVDDIHVISARDVSVRQMGADEAGTPGD
jgi:hypothetical protein